MFMDGASQHYIYKPANAEHRLISPMGLTLDCVNRRIYVTDAHRDHIMSIDYEGKNRLVKIEASAYPCVEQMKLNVCINALMFNLQYVGTDNCMVIGGI